MIFINIIRNVKLHTDTAKNPATYLRIIKISNIIHELAFFRYDPNIICKATVIAAGHLEFVKRSERLCRIRFRIEVG